MFSQSTESTSTPSPPHNSLLLTDDDNLSQTSGNTTLVDVQGESRAESDMRSENKATPKGKRKRDADDLDIYDGEERISKCVKKAHMEELQHCRDWSVIASALGEQYCQPFRVNRVEDHSLRMPTPSISDASTSTDIYQNPSYEYSYSPDSLEENKPSFMGVLWNQDQPDMNTLWNQTTAALDPIVVRDTLPAAYNEVAYNPFETNWLALIDPILDAGNSVFPAAVRAGLPSSHPAIKMPLEGDDGIQCRWGFQTQDAQWDICGHVLPSFKALVAHLEQSHDFLNKAKLNKYGLWDCMWLKWDQKKQKWVLCDNKRKCKGGPQGYAYDRRNILRHIEKEPGIRKGWQPILVPRDERPA